MKTDVIQQTQRILDLIGKRDLDDDGQSHSHSRFHLHHFLRLEKQELIDETVDNFNNYINPGFLKYRKSFSPDYVAGKFDVLCSTDRSIFPSFLLL